MVATHQLNLAGQKGKRQLPITVFWSWQNDYSRRCNRDVIHRALSEAVKQVASEISILDPDRIELDHDTKSTPGMVDISRTILEKISRSSMVVCDVTPIAYGEGSKAIPNPNVMVELGYALKALGFERLIAVLNTGSGCTIEQLPFDIRHRRILTYELRESDENSKRKEVERNLTRSLAGAIKVNLAEDKKTTPTSEKIEGGSS